MTSAAVSKDNTASVTLADKPPAIVAATGWLTCSTSRTRKALRPDPKHDRREDRNRQPAKDWIDEGRYDHLTSAEHETGDRERKKRSAGHHHQHEGADQPRQAHVRVDARQRRDQRAGQRGEPAADREGDEPDPRAVDAKPLSQRLVHDDGPRREAEACSAEQS